MDANTMALGWAGICLTFFVFFVAQMIAIARGFASLEGRFTRLEAKLGDKDNGVIAEVNDHEQRIRTIERGERMTPASGRLGGAISSGAATPRTEG